MGAIRLRVSHTVLSSKISLKTIRPRRFDLGFWYGSAFGSPVGRAQGIGYVQELVARLTKTPIATVRGANVSHFTLLYI